MTDVFVARQPIFDRTDRLAGYELLYRNTATSTVADGAAADAMCTDTVIHSFLDIGLDELTDGLVARPPPQRQQAGRVPRVRQLHA